MSAEEKSEKKTFFNVIGMSESFRKFDEAAVKQLASFDGETEVSNRQSSMFLALTLWQVRADFAKAQQLTVIAQELKTMNVRLAGKGNV